MITAVRTRGLVIEKDDIRKKLRDTEGLLERCEEQKAKLQDDLNKMHKRLTEMAVVNKELMKHADNKDKWSITTDPSVFKCKRCKKVLIEEEYAKHICTPTLGAVKKIEFDYYYIDKDEMNRELIMIKGMDGTLYGFVKRENKPSDKMSLFTQSSNDD
jgi:hypothetical protein